MLPSSTDKDVEIATIRAEMGGMKEAITRVDDSLQRLSESIGKLVEVQLNQESLGRRFSELEARYEKIDDHVDEIASAYRADKQSVMLAGRVVIISAVLIQVLFGWWLQSQITDVLHVVNAFPDMLHRITVLETRVK